MLCRVVRYDSVIDVAVPVVRIIASLSVQRVHQRLIVALDLPITRRVIRRRARLLDAEQLAQLSHERTVKRSALV